MKKNKKDDNLKKVITLLTVVLVVLTFSVTFANLTKQPNVRYMESIENKKPGNLALRISEPVKQVSTGNLILNINKNK